MSVKRPSIEKINELYYQWLRGKTLRQLAHEYPVRISHSTICIWFNKTYGEGATNPARMSLQRSLLEDSGGDQDVEAFVQSILHTQDSRNHRSHHSLKQLSKFQVVRDPRLMEYIAPVGGDPMLPLLKPRLSFLRLPMYYLLLSTIVTSLEDIEDGYGLGADIS